MENHKFLKDTKNWMKLNVLADHACIFLRHLFKKTWKETFKHEWGTTEAAIILECQNLKNVTKGQRETIEQGDIDKWDITLLKTILTTSDLLCLTSEQTASIIKIGNIHDDLADHPTKFVPERQFSILWKEIQQNLIDLGASKSELEQLKQESRTGGVAFMPEEEEVNGQNQTEALQLKEKGNACFNSGNFTKAIRLYTKAIGLTGLPGAQRAILYTNRCLTYLKSYEKKHGKNEVMVAELVLAEADAKKAVVLSPFWWRGYFRLGQVHLAMGKFSKAEDHFIEALAKEPQNKEIVNALNNVRMKKAQGEQMEYIDPRSAPNSVPESVQEVNQKRSSNLNPDACKNFLTANVDSPELKNFQDCFIGHCYKRGTDGYPRDDRLAAEHYRKAVERGSAQAMFNLGCMMLSGEGVEQDFEAGIKLLKEAASQSPTNQHNAVNFGVAESENALALCYQEGVGVTKDLPEAVHWYQRASKHGCSTASNNLGLMYERGIIDGKPDLVKAEQYYHTAAKSGLKPASFAMFNLARLCAQKGDPTRALEWCRRSKDNGNLNPCVDKLMEKLAKDIGSNDAADLWDSTGNVPADGLTSQERRNRFYSGVAPQLAASVSNHKIAERIMETSSLPTVELDSANVRFTKEELIKCSEKSAYGEHLWTAKQQCLAALDILNKIDGREKVPPMEDCEKFVTHFSAGAQLEFMVFELPPQWHRLAISIVNQLLTQETNFHEDVSVCYVSLQDTSSAKLTISFLNNCIQKYPKNTFFYKMRAKLNALLRRYEDSVLDSNTALQLCSRDWESLFARAQMMHLAGPAFAPQASINAYKKFIELAPKDHRKVPEAFYGIAHLIILKTHMCNSQLLSTGIEAIANFTKVKQCYDMGRASEKQQLTFFLPYVSSIKIKLENFFAEVTGMLGSSLGVTSVVKPKNPESNDLHKKLSDPYRIAKITQHRSFIDASQRMDLWTKNNCVNIDLTVTTPPPTQPSPESLANLETVSLEDMDPTNDFVYQGCVLDATVIDEVDFTGSSISLVIEDRNGHVERCFIYNCPVMADVAESRKEFGPGCQMSIINPYMRMTRDGKPAIRVDDPNTIIRKGFMKNMCRYCCKPNATLPCAKCKIALYCNEACKKLDWEKMQHELICV